MYTGFFNERDILAAEDKVLGKLLETQTPSPLFYQYVKGMYDLAHEIIQKREEVS